jgi:hypothetical protein
MTLMTHFQFSLARIDQLGYAKAIAFATSLAGVLANQRALRVGRIVEEGEPTHPPKSPRVPLSAIERRERRLASKRKYNATYRDRRRKVRTPERLARHVALVQAALALEAES